MNKSILKRIEKLEAKLLPQGSYPICKRGHERTPENTNTQGTCKKCARELRKQWINNPEGRASNRTPEQQQQVARERSERDKKYQWEYHKTPERMASRRKNRVFIDEYNKLFGSEYDARFRTDAEKVLRIMEYVKNNSVTTKSNDATS